MSWLIQLVAGLSTRRLEFDPRSVHVGFVEDKMALGQVFSKYFCFPVSVLFHYCSIPIFIYMLVLRGQTSEAWEPSKGNLLSGNRGALYN